LPPRAKLLTVLGVTFGLAVTVGNMIGAGILRTPGDIAAQLPTFWPFITVWIIGGLYALLGANALAELGTLVPESGGQYVFVRRALGDYAGLVVGWSDWISTCGTTAAVSIVVGEYSLVLFPQLRGIEPVALAVIAILTLIQWFGVRWGGWTQDATSLLKALAFLFLIAACFYLGGRHPTAPSIEAEREGSMAIAFILALQAVIYTYDGWTAVIYFSEEVKDSGRNIPRAMFGGVVAVMAIYLLMRTLKKADDINITEAKLRGRFEAWSKLLKVSIGLQPLITNEAVRSITVLAVSMKGDSDMTALKTKAKQAGFLLGEGYGDLKKSSFRVANFPALRRKEIQKLMRFLIRNF